MPITIEEVAAEATGYGHPFVGPGAQYTDVVKVDISDLGTREVDEDGYLKPGVPFAKDGNLVASTVPVYGVTLEPIKIASGNTDTILDAATDCFVALGTHGVVNRDIVEDNLGAALNADEIAGFALAGSHLHLTRT
jgi:hypothetical protein